MAYSSRFFTKILFDVALEFLLISQRNQQNNTSFTLIKEKMDKELLSVQKYQVEKLVNAGT